MNNLEILGWVIKNNNISLLSSFTYSGLIMDLENDISKKPSQEIVLKISEETFYNIYPHMLLLKEFYKAHIKIRDNMRGDFLEHMSKLLEKPDEI